MKKQNLPLGLYRHFKGGIYELMAIAKSSECPEELMAVYRSHLHPDEYWVRPLSMWSEKISKDGNICKRFTFIGKNIKSEE